MKKFFDFPKIMGVVNVTPDSFSDGGKFLDSGRAVDHALSLISDGADIIDIGGESSRPGADAVPVDIEMKRVIPVIKEIKSIIPNSSISIDTTKYEVASSAIDAGADIINDISALQFDERLAHLSAKHNKSLILMHMKGKPGTMQNSPEYIDVVSEIYDFLKQKIDVAKNIGVKDVIIDVGIGFGKTLEHNLQLLKNLDVFEKLGAKILLGISRKSFIGALTGIENPSARDLATVLLHAILLRNRIDIIRVHDVKSISLLKTLYNSIS